MAVVLKNEAVGKEFYLLKASGNYDAKMGQFCMLRAWEDYPILSRPISIFDCDGEGISFLYKVVGKGTELLAKLEAGDEIDLQGPYGNGFPNVQGKVALVGGGIGVAPLYHTAKVLKAQGCTVDLYLGFTDEALLQEAYAAVCDKLTVNIGGYVTDDINPADYDVIMTCGPQIMMKVLAAKVKDTAAQLYVSMENRMGCGVGACLVCSCKTSGGNKKVCKDGPVFRAEEVFGDE
jgi:dihydroorotate dehydrogenase electron transfer subunit